MRGLLLLISIFLFISCNTKISKYYYNSDLNKPAGYNQITVLFVKSDSLRWCTGNVKEIDSCDNVWKSMGKTKNMYTVQYFKGTKVIMVDSIFYIKDGVKSKKIINAYTNKVVDF